MEVSSDFLLLLAGNDDFIPSTALSSCTEVAQGAGVGQKFRCDIGGQCQCFVYITPLAHNICFGPRGSAGANLKAKYLN